MARPNFPAREPLPEAGSAEEAAARKLTPPHLQFCLYVLEGTMSHAEAYRRAVSATAKNAGIQAKNLLAQTRIKAYIAAVKERGARKAVLSHAILAEHALKLACGDDGDRISHSIQLEAIQYLDGCLNRNRTIKIDGLVLDMEADENHVTALAWAALEAEANGRLGADDARHLIDSAAMVQQIMHGRTIASGMERDVSPPLPKLPPPSAPPISSHSNGSNGHGGNGGSTTLTMPIEPGRPVRPRWLKSPEQIAEAAKARKQRAKEET